MKKNKKVLVVVDYQYDFVSGVLPVPEAETISGVIQKEIDSDIYDCIVYTMDTHIEDDYYNSEESKYFPDIHCEFNTPGWDFYKIKPKNREIGIIISEGVMETPKDFSVNNEFVFMKDKFSIWEGNVNYEKWFTENFNEDAEITIVGVALNYCVKFNATGYKDLGYKNVRIIERGTKGIIDDSYEYSIIEMKDKDIIFV